MTSIRLGRISAGWRYETRIQLVSTVASSASSDSSSLTFPRSLPYDEEFSLIRNSSRAPESTSHRASVMMSSGARDTYDPRKRGIAQKLQRRSQHDAIFSAAEGPLVSRRRWLRQGAVSGAAGKACAWAAAR